MVVTPQHKLEVYATKKRHYMLEMVVATHGVMQR